MKFVHLFGAASLFWLTACTTPPASPPTAGSTKEVLVGAAPSAKPAAAATAATGATAAPQAQHQAVIPGGSLRPITPAQAASRGVAQLAPPADLWERIRRGFAMNNLEGDLVRTQEQWYVSRPDYISRMTDRSRKYLFHIVEELERRNMPTELALLPFIESAFNPQAVSSAQAAGMWQFIPSTGRSFDLKQNVFRDDRRDVLASTRAALDYLQKLYGMFGDWQLALAAYNWGEGSVGRAIARNQKMGLGTSYSDLNMPNETRMYVPKLQAVKNIVANPQALGADLPLIENHPYFQTVVVARDIDVALAARLADVPLDDFKALNPSMKKPVILAAGTPQILLPWDNAQVFQRNFDAYTAGQYASWTAWTAPATMSAGDAARRVKMDENDFRAVNSIPPRMLIRAGSTVLVPRSALVGDDVAGHVADNAQMTLSPEIVTRRASVKAGKHDTVASIARRLKLNPSDVAQWNKVGAGASFRPGEQVVVFLPVRTGAAKVVQVAHRPGVKAVARGGKTVGKPVKNAAPRGKPIKKTKR